MKLYRIKETTRIDATCTNDPVQIFSLPSWCNYDIPFSDVKIRIKSGASIMCIHRDLIDTNSHVLWNQIKKYLAK